MKNRRYKNWWITLILGLIMPGVGHIYNGHLKKGVRWIVLFHTTILAIATISAQRNATQLGYTSALLLALCIWLFITLEGVFEVYGKKSPSPAHHYDYWFTPLLVITITLFGLTKPLLYIARERLVHFYFIPSKSMEPTLIIGDQVLVRPYGTHDTPPQSEDIVVFKNILDSNSFWIKRVVGLPGELITVEGLAVARNGVLTPQLSQGPCPDSLVLCGLSYSYRLPKVGDTYRLDTLTPMAFLNLYHLIRQENREKLNHGQIYRYIDGLYSSSLDLDTIDHHIKLRTIMTRDSLSYDQSRVTYAPVLFLGNTTQETHYTLRGNSYFLLGDNRLNSYDSRLLGPISSFSLTGEAKAVYLSFNGRGAPFHWERTGLPLTREYP